MQFWSFSRLDKASGLFLVGAILCTITRLTKSLEANWHCRTSFIPAQVADEILPVQENRLENSVRCDVLSEKCRAFSFKAVFPLWKIIVLLFLIRYLICLHEYGFSSHNLTLWRTYSKSRA